MNLYENVTGTVISADGVDLGAVVLSPFLELLDNLVLIIETLFSRYGYPVDSPSHNRLWFRSVLIRATTYLTHKCAERNNAPCLQSPGEKQKRGRIGATYGSCVRRSSWR